MPLERFGLCELKEPGHPLDGDSPLHASVPTLGHWITHAPLLIKCFSPTNL
jgi:hypothetical protein